MCGICGAVWTSPQTEISPNILDQMTDRLLHRGPDDRGTLRLAMIDSLPISEKGVALGHRRLSIIDLSEQGRQPMTNEDGTIWVTFNGEIYNFVVLRQDLKAKGHIFRTATDTEVIVHLYEEYGEHFPERLSGMFAIGLWDTRKKSLLLARDRMGKKPLYYRMESDRFLFASELKSLLAAGNVPKKLDILAFDEYLTYQYVPFPRTIYQNIAKLAPGELAVWSYSESGRGTFRTTQWWLPDVRENHSLTSCVAWQGELRKRLTQSVERRLQSDVPLGAFLSGGIDSTIIVGLMQQICPGRVRTFSIGFEQKEYDETDFARRTAARLGTNHQEFFVTPDAESIVPQLVAQYDEPFADSSAIPTWYLSEMTRQEVTVALSGDGGDELFAGYDRYKAMRWSSWLDRIPLIARQLLAGPVQRILPASVRQRSFTRRLKRFLEALAMSPCERYLQWIAIFNRQRKELLINANQRKKLLDEQMTQELTGADQVRQYDSIDFLKRYWQQFDQRDVVTTVSLTDLMTYLPCDLMTKVDIASMRHSLEVRAPFLDPEVIDLAIGMPLALKLRGQVGKHILRETFSEFLPAELLQRPKTGFGVPLDHWFRGPLRSMLHEVLLGSDSNRFGLFNLSYIRKLIKEHEQKEFDHAPRLWALLVFELWAKDNN